MRQRSFAFVLLLGVLFSSVEAQENKPLIQLNPFSIEGIGAEESQLIVSLVQSYLSDIGQLVNFLPPHEQADTMRPGPAPKSISPDSADYTINGTIRLERDGHMFMLEIMNTRTGENYAVSSVYKSTGEMALKTRSVLESAFTGGLEPEKKTAARPERLSEHLVSGIWKGEAGIEMIRLMQDGRGLAVFSSGAQMALSYTIVENTLKVWQISPNSERFYHPLPQHIAKQLALGAEPVTWELSLYQGGTVLGGVKLSTGVRIINGQAVELLPRGDVREVTWTKSGH
ncbi:MAG: hypothetical protein LBD48_00400 [Treponema sp.]|nr:hypothetical protein [Treponema sp.]